jgi:hypothetical protein
MENGVIISAAFAVSLSIALILSALLVGFPKFFGKWLPLGGDDFRQAAVLVFIFCSIAIIYVEWAEFAKASKDFNPVEQIEN